MITNWRVICPSHGLQFLTHEQYSLQLSSGDCPWCCPLCGGTAKWDDSWYENYNAALACRETQCVFPTRFVVVPNGESLKFCSACPWFDITDMDLTKDDYYAMMYHLYPRELDGVSIKEQ